MVPDDFYIRSEDMILAHLETVDEIARKEANDKSRKARADSQGRNRANSIKPLYRQGEFDMAGHTVGHQRESQG